MAAENPTVESKEADPKSAEKTPEAPERPDPEEAFPVEAVKELLLIVVIFWLAAALLLSLLFWFGG